MDGKLVDGAGLRRPDLDPAELILRGSSLLPELGDLGIRVAEIVEHSRLEILVELEDLELGLADLSALAGDRRDQLAALALEVCRVALQRRQLVAGREILRE